MVVVRQFACHRASYTFCSCGALVFVGVCSCASVLVFGMVVIRHVFVIVGMAVVRQFTCHFASYMFGSCGASVFAGFSSLASVGRRWSASSCSRGKVLSQVGLCARHGGRPPVCAPLRFIHVWWPRWRWSACLFGSRDGGGPPTCVPPSVIHVW